MVDHLDRNLAGYRSRSTAPRTLTAPLGSFRCAAGATGGPAGNNPEVILEAVRRAWLPEDIESVSSKYALEGNPPPLEGVESWMDGKPKIGHTAQTKVGKTLVPLLINHPTTEGGVAAGPSLTPSR